MTTPAIVGLTVGAPAPHAEPLATALAAITGTGAPNWQQVILGDGTEARRAVISIGVTVLAVVETAEANLPRSVALGFEDVDAAIERLRAAGFEVRTPGPGSLISEHAGTVTAGGVTLILNR